MGLTRPFTNLILFRPSRPDFIETDSADRRQERRGGLFRPSRPDFIETLIFNLFLGWLISKLFRPSRPDFIETYMSVLGLDQ